MSISLLLGGGDVAGGSGSSGDMRGSHERPPLCFLQNGGVISLIDCTLVEETESADEDRTYPWSNPTPTRPAWCTACPPIPACI